MLRHCSEEHGLVGNNGDIWTAGLDDLGGFSNLGDSMMILNCAPKKKESVGSYLLKQDVCGKPVAEFRFPPDTGMGPALL